MERKLFNKKSLLIIAAIAAIAAGMLIYRYTAGAENRTAEVSVDGTVVLQIDLGAVSRLAVYTLANGVVLQAQDRSVCFLQSNCKDEVCIKSGAISRLGEVAACVPNKTVVTIRGGQTNVDVVTY